MEKELTIDILSSVQKPARYTGGEFASIIKPADEVEATMHDMFQTYSEYKWAWFYSLILKECNIDSLTHDDAVALKAQLTRTREEWTAAIKYDAEKEYAMGDVDEETLNDFVRTIE